MPNRIVADSSCDLPAGLAAQHGPTVVPLGIHIGSKSYLDGVEMTHEQLFKGLPDLPSHSTTFVPCPGQFVQVYERLAQLASDHFDVVLLAWELSGRSPGAFLSSLHRLSDRPSAIVLSGRPELEPRERAAGADAFVSMCDPPPRLLATLQAIEGEKSWEA